MQLINVSILLISTPVEWAPGLWLDLFEELLYDDEELNYGDQWSLTFDYNLSETLDQNERRRGWKIFCYRARGKYV